MTDADARAEPRTGAGPPIEELVRQHEGRLFGIAYRILGTVTDAEDAVQEAFLRLSQRDDVRDAEAWLVTVVTRLALGRLRSAQRRRETYVGPWLPEPVVEDADPAAAVELAESLSMAFLVVLEELTPEERVAFLLHDVFALPYVEIGRILERRPDACRQLASRARRRVAGAGRSTAQGAGEERWEVARRFLAACTTGDLDGLLELLAPDVVARGDGGGVVSAIRRPVEGARPVARFLLGLVRQAAGGFEVEEVTVNGGPGAIVRIAGEASPTVLSIDVAGGWVVALSVVRNPAKIHLGRRRT